MQSNIPIKDFINKKQTVSSYQSIKGGGKEISYQIAKLNENDLKHETISLTFQLITLISFLLNTQFNEVWKPSHFWSSVLKVIQFSQIIPMVNYNKGGYYVVFYACAIAIISLFALFIFLLVCNKKPNKGGYFILKNMLVIMIYPLYTTIINVLLSIMACDQGFNVYQKSLKCWDISHTFQSCISLLLITGFFGFGLLLTIILPSRNMFKNNPVTEVSISSFDALFLTIKTLYAFTHTFIQGISYSSLSEGIIILVYFSSSLLLISYYYIGKPHIIINIRVIYLVILSILFSGNCSLLMSKLLKNSHYNDGLNGFIVLSFLALGVHYSIDYEGKEINNINIIFDPKNATEALNKLKSIIYLVSKVKDYRAAKIILKGYIYNHEEKCLNKDCSLKMIVNGNATNNDSDDGNIIYIYQHIEELFSTYGELFECNSLRVEYSIFLLTCLHKNKQSLQEFQGAKNHRLTLSEDFGIEKYIKYVENQDEFSIKCKKNNNIDKKTIEMGSNIKYRQKMSLFKEKIQKVSFLYGNFWTYLIQSSQDDKDCLTKLNKTGNYIVSLNKEIESLFDKLQKKREYDSERLKLYTSFLRHVVNDKEKLGIIINKKVGTTTDTSNINHSNHKLFNDDNLDISSIGNPNVLSANDDNNYIIVGGNTDNFGTIINISLRICTYLGYNKQTLIGRNYSELLPMHYIDEHNKMLKYKIDKLRETLLSSGSNEIKVHNDNKSCEIEAFLINRSKLGIPIILKGAGITNEYNDCLIIAKITLQNSDIIEDNEPTQENAIKNRSNSINILVNKELEISYYQISAIKKLGLSNDGINNTVMISEFIKEMNDFIWKSEGNNNEKETLILEKYLNKTQNITWTKHGMTEIYDLTVKEQRISSVLLGYTFTFYSNTKKISKDSCIDDNNVNSSKNQGTNSNIIDKDYIPSDKSYFNFNVSQLAFSKNNQDYISRDKIRDGALFKINNIKTKKNETINEESTSYIEENSELSQSQSQSLSGSSSKESTSSVRNPNNDLNTEKLKSMTSHEGENTFFKVNMAKIKFSLYDFKKHELVCIENYSRISEMELKLHESNNDEQKGNNDSISAFTQKDVGFKTSMNSKLKETNHNSETIGEDKTMKLKNKIKNLGAKQETPLSLHYGKISALITLFLLLGIGSSFGTVYIIAFKMLIENNIVIQNGLDIAAILLRAYYSVMEIGGLTYKNYTNKPVDYLAEELRIQGVINNFAKTIANKRLIITTTFTRFDKNLTSLLAAEDILIGTIVDDFKIHYAYISINEAYSEIISSLRIIACSDTTVLYPTNKHMYYYLYNSCNGVYAAQKKHIGYYINAFVANVKIQITYACILYAVSVLSLLFIFFIINITFQKVVHKKESYGEVFFDIEKDVLFVFIENIDYFSKKIQMSINKSAINIIENNDRNNLESVNNDSELIEDETTNIIVSGAFSKNNKSKTQKRSLSKDAVSFLIKFILALIVVFAYITTTFLLFLIYLNNFKLLIFVNISFFELFLTYIRFFSSMRTYVFDQQFLFMNNFASMFDQIEIPYIYQTIHGMNSEVTDKIDNYPNTFINLFKSVSEGDICYYSKNRTILGWLDENNPFDCDTFFYGNLRLGLNHMISTYTLEIITVKNDYSRLKADNKDNFIYNLTGIGSTREDENKPKDAAALERYWKYHPINIFNSERIKNIYVFYTNILLSAFTELKTSISESMNSILQEKDNGFKGGNSVFIVVIFIFVVGLLIPYIINLDNIIYLTKNMLVIIPIDILADIPDILSVLNANSINEDSSNRSVVAKT